MDTQVFDNAERLRKYEEKKAKLMQELLALSIAQGNGIRLKKTTSNLFRDRKPAKKKIDVRHFNQVISIDSINQTAEIEGMTTYEEIVNKTLEFDFLPTVVPQLKSITIGGALAGCGIESSSFRYGLAHETMLEYEVILGDGRVITVNQNNEHQKFYYAFPNTYGTLGYALKIKIKLIPVKKYVKLNHLHFTNAEEYFLQLKKLCGENRTQSPICFIDGVIFDKDNMYITLGEFVDDAPFTSNYKYMNIYYQSIKRKSVDYLITKDYIWRWDSDWFWCSKNFFMQNYFVRFLFGKLMLKSTVYMKIRRFFNSNKFARKVADAMTGPVESVIQDVEIPIHHAKNFLDFFQHEIGIKPIWICPTKAYQENHLYSFYEMDPNILYVNFGFWDMVPTKHEEGFYNKKIENKVQELDGNKSLYSRVYYSEDQFWKIFNKELYDSLKKQYDPKGSFSDLFLKCHGN
ncbi:hypothetical protein EP47_08155 [Legionella norrlandica]|uniref:Delta(24)-sterol reductase n=1 Tax=Legionella norrlandica TaxID=1498499 RepID=A0A0A2SWJ4_9GAMM|nr:FAD-binding oxidoreductase [Legionella norrlandica]KGP64106.1 hypothetical protein EP47_08155 [Legionella norrlandica]